MLFSVFWNRWLCDFAIVPIYAVPQHMAISTEICIGSLHAICNATGDSHHNTHFFVMQMFKYQVLTGINAAEMHLRSSKMTIVTEGSLFFFCGERSRDDELKCLVSIHILCNLCGLLGHLMILCIHTNQVMWVQVALNKWILL